MTTLSSEMTELGIKAKEAALKLGRLTEQDKNEALLEMAQSLEKHTKTIILANQKDIERAQNNGLAEPLVERLTLNEKRIQSMVAGLRQVASLPDPLTVTDEEWVNTDGLRIARRRVPLGVLGIIYESRPNVTADASALALKAGNATILRGGSEAISSNLAIAKALQKGLDASKLPKETIQIISNTDRKYSNELMQMDDYVDTLIPRGGQGLIQAVKKNATIPVIETASGNCHLYIENTADIKMAADILFNAKTQRPSVCNAIETLIIDEKIAETELENFLQPLIEAHVEIRGDQKTQDLVENVQPTTEEDYKEEFLALVLAVKVVTGYEEAISHIAKYSTGHSEAIITKDYQHAQNFLNDVDAAAVYVNASTRFTDGEVFGFGGEIGISTQKLHARGPMGLEALTSYKYVIQGNGQIRE
jgi:glutamate-5-semialdehyde dehydrogenase